jgi:hypothetical protein
MPLASLDTPSADRRDQRVAHPEGEAGGVGGMAYRVQPQRGGTSDQA